MCFPSLILGSISFYQKRYLTWNRELSGCTTSWKSPICFSHQVLEKYIISIDKLHSCCPFAWSIPQDKSSRSKFSWLLWQNQSVVGRFECTRHDSIPLLFLSFPAWNIDLAGRNHCHCHVYFLDGWFVGVILCWKNMGFNVAKASESSHEWERWKGQTPSTPIHFKNINLHNCWFFHPKKKNRFHCLSISAITWWSLASEI